MKWVLVIGGVVLGAVLLGVLVLAGLGYREGAGRIQGTAEIARPAAEVWPWIVEEEKLTQWVSWLIEVHDLTPGREGNGARRKWVMIDPNMNNQRMEIEGEVVEFEPGRVSSMKLNSPGMFTGRGTYRLTELGDGRTRVEYVSTFEMESAMARLLEPVITPQAQKKAEDDLASLKRAVEAEPRGLATGQ